MLIDTHCHLNFKDFKEDADEVIKRTLENDVQLINVGAEWRTSQRAIEYAEKYTGGVWAVVGLHPIYINIKHKTYSTKQKTNKLITKIEKEIFDYKKYLQLAQNKKVVAIGEVGLDYHHFDKNLSEEEILKIKNKQKEVFKKFIRLADEVKKPIAIHCWDAYSDLLEILKENLVKRRGVVHSFIGNYKTAEKFIELGFKIGLNGIVTYSESYDKLIKKIGLENIVLETDAPYLTPSPLERYSRNEPLNVKLVAQKIADVLKIDIKEVEKQTTNNARKLFTL